MSSRPDESAKRPKTILAAETSTDINSVALCISRPGDGNPLDILAEVTVQCRRRHAERLLGTIEFVMEEAGLAWSSVDALAIPVGPGSFTGLRIGIATFKGLAFAHGLPLVGVPTLHAMARIPHLGQGLVCPMLDARMKEVFAALFRCEDGDASCLAEPAVLPVETFLTDPAHCDILAEESVLFLGDGARCYEEDIRGKLATARFGPAMNDSPRAWAVAMEAMARLSAGEECGAAQVNPVYLRLSQAEMNRGA